MEPVTLETLLENVRPYGGKVHGSDAQNVWDVEFPFMLEAAKFAHEMWDKGWRSEIRSPGAMSLHARVTLNVWESVR